LLEIAGIRDGDDVVIAVLGSTERFIGSVPDDSTGPLLNENFLPLAVTEDNCPEGLLKL